MCHIFLFALHHPEWFSMAVIVKALFYFRVSMHVCTYSKCAFKVAQVCMQADMCNVWVYTLITTAGKSCLMFVTSVCLSPLQGTSANLRTIFITSTLCALKSETWRPAPSCLRSPNPHIQVLCMTSLLALLMFVWARPILDFRGRYRY